MRPVPRTVPRRLIGCSALPFESGGDSDLMLAKGTCCGTGVARFSFVSAAAACAPPLFIWHWLLTLVHGFGLHCFLSLLGGVVVNRCLQIAGTVGSGGGCRCTPLVARDRLGLVVRSRHRSRAVNCRRHRPRRACAAPGVADGLTWVRFSEARLRRNHRSVRWEGQKRPSDFEQLTG